MNDIKAEIKKSNALANLGTCDICHVEMTPVDALVTALMQLPMPYHEDCCLSCMRLIHKKPAASIMGMSFINSCITVGTEASSAALTQGEQEGVKDYAVDSMNQEAAPSNLNTDVWEKAKEVTSGIQYHCVVCGFNDTDLSLFKMKRSSVDEKGVLRECMLFYCGDCVRKFGC